MKIVISKVITNHSQNWSKIFTKNYTISPFFWKSISILSGIELNNLKIVFMLFSLNSATALSIACQWSSDVDIVHVSQILQDKRLHTVSIILRSGLLAGHFKIYTFFLLRKSTVMHPYEVFFLTSLIASINMSWYLFEFNP